MARRPVARATSPAGRACASSRHAPSCPSSARQKLAASFPAGKAEGGGREHEDTRWTWSGSAGGRSAEGWPLPGPATCPLDGLRHTQPGQRPLLPLSTVASMPCHTSLRHPSLAPHKGPTQRPPHPPARPAAPRTPQSRPATGHRAR
eukprot:359816-Chlamydomonas_euryale.AAC.5